MIKVVAEISANHNGAVETAKRLIDAAAWAGAYAVKGQKRDVEHAPAEWDRPYENEHSYGRTYLEHRRALELSIEQHAELSEYAAGRDLVYYASAWDALSARALAAVGFDAVKVPSARVTDVPLLTACAGNFRHVHLSTGMSTIADVVAAAKILGDRLSVIYQCTSAYPTSPQDVNLGVLDLYRQMFPRCEVGVSGHWLGIMIDAVAVYAGATWVERHLTLDRAGKGRDHAASLEPDGLRRVVRDCQAAARLRGDGRKRVLECEREAMGRLK